LKPHDRHTIVIAPIGDFAPDLLDAVGRGIQRAFGFATAVRPILPSLGFAFDSTRAQYHSTPILEKLSAAVSSDAIKVLALANVDLFIPILTHVYGEAQLGGNACIVSTYRLNAAAGGCHHPEQAEGRVVKESIHELGHTFSLRHCRDPACIMHYCRSETDVDRKSNELCRYCRVMLNDELKRITGW
jgi:archaemetzincin